jgi:hypothetical protein
MEISFESVQIGKSLRDDMLLRDHDQRLKFGEDRLLVYGPPHLRSRLGLFRRTGSNLLENLLL